MFWIFTESLPGACPSVHTPVHLCGGTCMNRSGSDRGWCLMCQWCLYFSPTRRPQVAACSIGLHPAEYPLSSPALQTGTGCLQDGHPSQRTTRYHPAGHCAGAGPAGGVPQEDGKGQCRLRVSGTSGAGAQSSRVSKS